MWETRVVGRSNFTVGVKARTVARGALSILMAVAGAGVVRADSVNSPNITMNVDTNRSVGNGAGGVSITINTITIAETMVNEYSAGADKTIVFTARSGIQFDPTSNVTAQSATIGFNGAAANAAAAVTPTGVADETITFTLTSGTSGGQDIIRVNGVRLRILSAVGAAGPAQTTVTVTTSTAGGAFTNQGIVAAAITPGAADRLVFAAQPGSTQSGADLLPAVKIVDFGGNLVSNDVRTITLMLASNPGAATLLGITAQATDTGVATWIDTDDLRIATAAAGYTLRASHSGTGFLTSDTVDSGLFDISAGAPNQLVFTLSPVDTEAGGNILLTVTVRDQAGNTATGVTAIITLDSAVNPGGWPLLVDSSLSKATVAGVAMWDATDHLRINKAIDGYRLQASGVGAPIQTNTFNITAAAANSLRFVTQPTNTQANVDMDPSVVIEVTDAFGNSADSDDQVELILRSDCGGVLSGGSADIVSGIATFDDLEIDAPCADVELEAALENLPRTSSDPFDVTALPAAALRFVQQPTSVEQDAAINPPVSIEIIDTVGNRTDSTATVQLTVLSSCGGTLSTTSVAAVGGLATFALLSLDTPCTAITLQAAAAGLTGATSDAFDVTELPAVPVALSFLQQPTDVEEDVAISPPVSIEILDAAGARTNTNTAIELTLVSDCGGTLSTTSLAAVDGLAIADDLSIDTPCADVTLRATADGLTDAMSDPFEVTMAPDDGDGDGDGDMDMVDGAACGQCGQGGAMGMIPMLMILIGLKWRFANQRNR